MKHLLGYRAWGRLLTQTATLHPQPFPPAWDEHHWDSALLWEQDPASTCFVPLRKQTAFSFSVCKAALHLFKWQLQRPSMTLNNNRKLNQRVCRGIQSFPFHHRLQRPFLLKGSQEYAGQWTSLSLQTPPLSIPVPTDWWLRTSFSFGQVKPQPRSMIWPKLLYPREYRMSPNFPCIWETRGTFSPPLHPLPSNPSKWQHKEVFKEPQ